MLAQCWNVLRNSFPLSYTIAMTTIIAHQFYVDDIYITIQSHTHFES